MTEKHTEYLVSPTSIGINAARRALLHLGRYHGFDMMVAGVGGNIPLKLTHTSPVQVVSDANVKVPLAAFVTGHGVVVTTDEEPTVEVLVNASGVTQYQTLYAEYTWANSLGGGSAITYGTGATSPTQPELPPSMPAIQTPLGYFTIIDGAVDITGVTYTPYDSPNVAGKADLDLSGYATLVGPNKFTGMNALSEAELAKTSLVINVEGAPHHDLTLSETANVFNIAALDAGSYTIDSILFTGDRVAEDGEVFYLNFAPSSAIITWGNVNMAVDEEFKTLTLTTGGVFVFARIGGTYRAISMLSTTRAIVSLLSSRVNTLEEAIQANAEAIAEWSTPAIDTGKVLEGNGYVKFANGLILQWASYALGDLVAGSAQIVKTFPIAFPTAVFQVLLTVQNTTTSPAEGFGLERVRLYQQSLTGFTVTTYDDVGDGYNQNVTIRIIALGK